MTEQRIAIIGGGILGSTVAYYLSKAKDWEQYDVTLFDDGEGQATSAAAGIISPWVSKRRNQRWYRLASEGAVVVNEIANDLQMPNNVYRQCGTIITRDSDEKVDELFELAMQRREDAPMMGEIKKLSAAEINQANPLLKNQLPGIIISGGALINGAGYAKMLRDFAKARNLISKKIKVTLTKEKNKIKINKENPFDKVIICAGAWMNEVIKPLSLELAIYPQKGQLIQFYLGETSIKNNLPVLMPEGEYDIIPVSNKEVIVGATHENDQGFDIRPSSKEIESLIDSGSKIVKGISPFNMEAIQVGTRAYTNDFAPYFGTLPEFDNVIVGGGLGSSGLTTGPKIAQLIAKQITENGPQNWSEYTKPVENYLK
ncbi:NAD(P)/FAD-dependent oxidoreductase [Lactobacillaceae bacterium Scapto_B20]